MNATIINPHGDLSRERWVFSLVIGYSGDDRIYLDAYVFETKESPRHRNWHSQTTWTRLDKRSNNIDNPPVDANVEAWARQSFVNQIKDLPLISN